MPGAQVVGIQIDVQENASIIGPRVAQVFERIGDAGAEAGASLQDAFDFSKAESQLEIFANKVDKLYETKFGRQRELELKYMELRNQTLESKLKSSEGRTSTGAAGTLLNVAKAGASIGQAASQAGTSGNGAAAGASVVETLGGMVAKAGPAGIAVAATAGVLGASAVIIDQLSKTYEPFISTLMETTAALGKLSKSSEENSITFRSSLHAAAEEASKFGYSIEVGTQVMNKLAHGGLGAETGAALSDVMSYARGYGVNPESLVNARIMASRYGGGTNILGLAAGGVNVQGIGAGRYEEYLNALTSAMEEAVSNGVSKSFEDISSTLNFFSRLGPMWQGQAGAQKVAGLNQAVAGATSLQNETDVILYRAARAEAAKNAKGAFDYVDVMQQMEKGMTVGMFQQIYEQIKSMTGGSRTDMIEMLRQTFGVNYSMAASLYQAGATGGPDLTKLVSKLAPPSADSTEMKLLKAQQDLRLVIIEAGEALTTAKTELVTGMKDVVTWLAKSTGVDLTAQERRANDKQNATAAASFGKEYGPKFTEWTEKAAATLPGQQLVSTLSNLGIGGMNGVLMEMMGALNTPSSMTTAQFKTNKEAAAKLIDSLRGLNNVQIGMLSGGKYASQMQDIISKIGNKDYTLQPGEISDFYQKFQPILDAVIKESESYTKKSAPIGTIKALSQYTKPNTAVEGDTSLQTLGRYGLQQLVNMVDDLRKPQRKGLFGESDAAYNERIEKANKLEAALTGLTTNQLEGLIGSGKLGEMYSTGQLSTKDIDLLIRALQENTAALTAPSTVLVQQR